MSRATFCRWWASYLKTTTWRIRSSCFTWSRFPSSLAASNSFLVFSSTWGDLLRIGRDTFRRWRSSVARSIRRSELNLGFYYFFSNLIEEICNVIFKRGPVGDTCHVQHALAPLGGAQGCGFAAQNPQNSAKCGNFLSAAQNSAKSARKISAKNPQNCAQNRILRENFTKFRRVCNPQKRILREISENLDVFSVHKM